VSVHGDEEVRMVLIIEYGMEIDHFMAELTKVFWEEKPIMV
jgi:hypothetical protein